MDEETTKLLALTRGKRADNDWTLYPSTGWTPSLVDRRRLVGTMLAMGAEAHGGYTTAMINLAFALHSTDDDDRAALAECFARWMQREDQ